MRLFWICLGGTTGIMGGFTTYSTFNYETLRFLQESAWWMGLANLGATVASCLAAGVLGFLAGGFLGGS